MNTDLIGIDWKRNRELPYKQRLQLVAELHGCRPEDIEPLVEPFPDEPTVIPRRKMKKTRGRSVELKRDFMRRMSEGQDITIACAAMGIARSTGYHWREEAGM